VPIRLVQAVLRALSICGETALRRACQIAATSLIEGSGRVKVLLSALSGSDIVEVVAIQETIVNQLQFRDVINS
jgi:hypothetical protein